MIYLDHAATTPVPRAVAETMVQVMMEDFGNPGAAKLEVKGVPFGSGFVLNKIPDGDAVQVDYNGRTVRKSVRVSGGTLRVVLTVQTPYGGEDKLVITMRSN